VPTAKKFGERGLIGLHVSCRIKPLGSHYLSILHSVSNVGDKILVYKTSGKIRMKMSPKLIYYQNII
jgi:hypothetical protein